MAELVVRFDVRFGERWARVLMAAAMFFAAVPELASESVTLTTYYPAPSGVYSQMITTGNTWLARDPAAGVWQQVVVGGSALPAAGTGLAVMNGNVGIGKLNAGGMLDVNGTTFTQKLETTGNNAVNTTSINGNPSLADIVIGSSDDGGSRHDSSMMFWSNASASRIFNQSDVFYLSMWQSAAVSQANVALAATWGGTSTYNGPVIHNGNITINPGTTHHYVLINAGSSGCIGTTFTQGFVCSPGWYATWTAGVAVTGQWQYQNRGGEAYVNVGGVATYNVMTYLSTWNGSPSAQQYGTITQNDSQAYGFCCPF